MGPGVLVGITKGQLIPNWILHQKRKVSDLRLSALDAGDHAKGHDDKERDGHAFVPQPGPR